MAIHASKVDYRNAFAGLMFPASKDQIVSRSRMQGGIDREVFAVLSAIPHRSYRSMEELEAAVRGVYVARGEAAESLPV
jgi:hypothetical protein